MIPHYQTIQEPVPVQVPQFETVRIQQIQPQQVQLYQTVPMQPRPPMQTIQVMQASPPMPVQTIQYVQQPPQQFQMIAPQRVLALQTFQPVTMQVMQPMGGGGQFQQLGGSALPMGGDPGRPFSGSSLPYGGGGAPFAGSSQPMAYTNFGPARGQGFGQAGGYYEEGSSGEAL